MRYVYRKFRNLILYEIWMWDIPMPLKNGNFKYYKKLCRLNSESAAYAICTRFCAFSRSTVLLSLKSFFSKIHFTFLFHLLPNLKHDRGDHAPFTFIYDVAAAYKFLSISWQKHMKMKYLSLALFLNTVVSQNEFIPLLYPGAERFTRPYDVCDCLVKGAKCREISSKSVEERCCGNEAYHLCPHFQFTYFSN